MADDVFLNEQQFRNIFREHLKVEANQKSIDSLFAPRLRSRINFKPYYQRNYVWDTAKASYFIESIMLGTEIPPLIFFKHGEDIEVIDGRQRFETIDRFYRDELTLSQRGLDRLKGLARNSFKDLSTELVSQFLDTKLRIIWFEIVGEPPLESILEDKIKKEIFRRYNTGITPLKRAELDNAIYDSDEVTQQFKARLVEKPSLAEAIRKLFLHSTTNTVSGTEQITQFARRSLVLHRYPIQYYAWGSSRSDTLEHLYDIHVQNSGVSADELISKLEGYVDAIAKFNAHAERTGVRTNRFFLECVLWAMTVLEQEEKDPIKELNRISAGLINLVAENHAVFFTDASHYHKAIMGRYSCVASFFASQTGVQFDLYIGGSRTKQRDLRPAVGESDTKSTIAELSELRVNKPAPSTASIDDVIRVMRRRKYLIRPSYQRGEVINAAKASGIIESILLRVPLPPIFVFERADGVLEVVDGQQRLLTILGFVGEQYVDESGAKLTPRLNQFALKDLRILEELDGKQFRELSQDRQDQILDFDLFMVEIQELKNPSFDPVDLFVRLNDKPYPIKEHSFEMWNSWADKDCVAKIRELAEGRRNWFYVRRFSRDGYRMQNEELLATLVYLELCIDDSERQSGPEVFGKGNTVAVRLRNKALISSLLADIGGNAQLKKRWHSACQKVGQFLRNLRVILLDRDLEENQVEPYLAKELDGMIKGSDAGSGYASRSQQGVYILWLLIHGLSPQRVLHSRLKLKEAISEIMGKVRHGFADSSDPASLFREEVRLFRSEYENDERRIRLSDEQIAERIRTQGGICAISGAPLFKGDEVHVDHIEPIGLGGEDAPSNLQVAHPTANWAKGCKNA